MARQLPLALLLLALFTITAPAQVDEKKPADPPKGHGEIEVHFLNGSTVRMVVDADRLEVVTVYGTLAVPMRDVRSIEFGLHFPDGVAAKIDRAVRDLASPDYRDRETAAKALVDLGPYSYPAVLEAAGATDLDVARRARELVKRLQAAHPKADLKTSTDDKVVTPAFTILGRIKTPAIRAKADYFGDVKLSLATLRTLRALAGPGQEVDVTVDASKYANAGAWLETPVRVDGRATLVITAKGLVDTWPQQPGQWTIGPNGMPNAGPAVRVNGLPAGAFPGRRAGAVIGQAQGGMLFGKVGEAGDPFFIGERYEAAPDGDGKLYLHIGPSPWNCPSAGGYDVKISRKN